MRPFRRTITALWTTAAMLASLTAVLWGTAALGILLLPDDDGLGTAFVGIYLLALGLLCAAAAAGFALLSRARAGRSRPGHTSGA